MRIVIAIAMMLLVPAGADLALAQTPQERIDTAITRAREAGIPVALLESKIAEGRAKGVPMDRIATAIERREAALGRATQALRGQPDIGAAGLAVAADAIESGVSEAVLLALVETSPRDRRAVAIAALSQLVELGHVPEAALERVRDALKRGPEALLNLPAEAAGATGRRGGPPDPRTPGAAGGRGQGGPPAGVPAPGNSPQPTRPGGPPANPGKGTTGPGAGRGGSGGA